MRPEQGFAAKHQKVQTLVTVCIDPAQKPVLDAQISVREKRVCTFQQEGQIQFGYQVPPPRYSLPLCTGRDGDQLSTSEPLKQAGSTQFCYDIAGDSSADHTRFTTTHPVMACKVTRSVLPLEGEGNTLAVFLRSRREKGGLAAGNRRRRKTENRVKKNNIPRFFSRVNEIKKKPQKNFSVN